MPQQQKRKNSTRNVSDSHASSAAADTSRGLRNSLHGNVFQLKLLVLFLIRGIGKNYCFQLATELPGLGGKFDDLIFKYKVDTASKGGKQERYLYRYLQAKHKQDETTKITAALLLQDDDSDFSLAKYFRSYCHDIITGREKDVQDCIICTNIGFDMEDLKNKGIELENVSKTLHKTNDSWEKEILAFENVQGGKTAILYKLKSTDTLRQKIKEWSNIHLLAKKLLEIAETKDKKLTLHLELFKSYHVALFSENVLFRLGKKLEAKFHQHFLKEENIQKDYIKQFREILANLTFVHYLETRLKMLAEDDLEKRTEDTSKKPKVVEKKLEDFDGLILTTLQTEFKFDIFDEYRQDMIDLKVIDIKSVEGNKQEVKFSQNFVRGVDLPAGVITTFRSTLRNAVFVHYWKDVTFKLSGKFGQKQKDTSDKSLDDFVKSKDIDSFIDKLVFAVETPNEDQLGKILADEVGKYYETEESDFQYTYILEKMLDWFKEKKSKWYSSVDGNFLLKQCEEKMESLRITAVSTDYKEKLNVLKFNEHAIQKIVSKLAVVGAGNLSAEERKLLFLDSSNTEKFKHITTTMPRWTVVKVISALNTLPYYKRIDSYLVASWERFKTQKSMERWKKTLQKKRSPFLLIVVCEDTSETEHVSSYETLIQDLISESAENNNLKKAIIISNCETTDGLTDEVKYDHLDGEFQNHLISKKVIFQGKEIAVEELILNTKDIDLTPSMEELLDHKNAFVIPLQSTLSFEELHEEYRYFDRALKFPLSFAEQDVIELARKLDYLPHELLREKCKFDPNGNIDWQTNECKPIWNQINKILIKKGCITAPPSSIREFELIKKDGKNRVVIISGVAGTGKSTLLSHYYQEIKEEAPFDWVIKIDLADHYETISKLADITKEKAINFFVNLASIVGHSRFARLLLKRRLETGKQTVLMLDGFDEIGSECRERTIQLIKFISEINQVYITTRPHFNNELQDELFQFAYTLENFSRNDQINYLFKFWKSKHLRTSQIQNQDGIIWNFAKLLVDRVAATLKDKDRSFVGIPLQCRILAECYGDQLQKEIQEFRDQLSNPKILENALLALIENQKFDLVSLYRLLMDTKRRVFRGDKAKALEVNVILDLAIELAITNTETYMTQMAIDTTFSANHVNILCPDQLFDHSKAELEDKRRILSNLAVRFGLADVGSNRKLRFLHRTFAEYLVAEYINKGFLDEKLRSGLLDAKQVQEFVVEILLVTPDFEGVRVFFDMMLKKNEENRFHIIFPNSSPFDEVDKSQEFLAIRLQRTPVLQKEQAFQSLAIAGKESKLSIFNFLIVYFEAKYGKSEVLEYLAGSSFNSKYCFILCYQTSHCVLEYFNCAPHEVIKKLLKNISLNHFLTIDSRNTPEIKEILRELMAFMENHYKIIESDNEMAENLFSQYDGQLYNMFQSMVFEEYYNSETNVFLSLLSMIFPGNSNAIVGLFKEIATLGMYKYNPQSLIANWNRGMTRVFHIFQTLGRTDVLERMPRLLLAVNPQVFQHVYNLDSLSSLPSFEWWERGPDQMTWLHRAAFYNHKEQIEEILYTYGEVCSFQYDTQPDDVKLMAARLINCMARDDDGFTPLYVAAIRGHKEVLHNMLDFLKQSLSQDQLKNDLTHSKGFLHSALLDAIEFNYIEIVRLILESVKLKLKQNALIDLLKSKLPVKSLHKSIIGACCENSNLLDTVVEIVVKSDNISDAEGYENHLIDLIFHDEEMIDSTLMELNAEMFLKKIFPLKSPIKWTHFLLGFHKGLKVLLSHFIDKFNEDELSVLVEMILQVTENEDGIKGSIWSKYLQQSEGNMMNNLLKRASQFQSGMLENLVLHDDGNGQLMLQSTLWNAQELAQSMLAHLPEKEQYEMGQNWWTKEARKIIEDRFFSPRSHQFWTEKHDIFMWRNTLNFYLDHADDEQMDKFIWAVTILRNIEGGPYSIWGYFTGYENRNCLDQVLERVSTKIPYAVKELVLHDDGNGAIIVRAIEQEDRYKVGTLMKFLSEEDRTDVCQFLKLKPTESLRRSSMNQSLETLDSSTSTPPESRPGSFHEENVIPE